MAEQNINVAQQDTLETVASNVSTINTNAARLTAARATKIDNIGATGDTGGSSTAGTLFGKLNKIISDITTFVGNWTATRAGYIDNIRSYTITNNTASKTGVLSAKLAYVISLLENTTYGLNAIKTAMGSGSSSTIKSIQRGVADPANYKNSNGYALTQWTININTVNPNKTIVILKDSYIAVKGGSSSYGENGMHGAYLISLSATSFTIGYNGSNENMSYGYTYGYPVSWQVIEFV